MPRAKESWYQGSKEKKGRPVGGKVGCGVEGWGGSTAAGEVASSAEGLNPEGGAMPMMGFRLTSVFY